MKGLRPADKRLLGKYPSDIRGLRDFLSESVRKAKESKGASVDSILNDGIFIKDLDSNLVKFRMNPVQILHKKNKEKYNDRQQRLFLLLKARRMGFTTYEQAHSFAVANTRKFSNLVTIGPTKEDTKSIFKMVQVMHDFYPNKNRLRSENSSELEYIDLYSRFHIGTAGAKSFSRGDNIFKVHGSEVAHWDLNDDHVDNLTAGIIGAARNGEVIYETTAAGASGWFYEKYSDAMAGKNNWIPLFYPWFEDSRNSIAVTDQEAEEIIETLSDYELELVLKHKDVISIDKIAWYRYTQKTYTKLMPQEYPSDWNEAFMVSGYMFFDIASIRRHVMRSREPVYDSNGYTVWVRPIKGHKYVIGADTSEGVEGGDYSYAGVLDLETGEQVARWYGRPKPEVFARELIKIAKEYNKAILAIEKNNHGGTVISNCQIKGYTNLYCYVNPIKYKEKEEPQPGFPTNAFTRPLILDKLNEAMNSDLIKCNDNVFLEQAKIFVDNGHNRYEAKGGKDDGVLAWAIAWFVATTRGRGMRFIL